MDYEIFGKVTKNNTVGTNNFLLFAFLVHFLRNVFDVSIGVVNGLYNK